MAQTVDEPIESFYVGSISHSDKLDQFDWVPSQGGLHFGMAMVTLVAFAFAFLVPIMLVQQVVDPKNRIVQILMWLALIPAAWVAMRTYKALEPWANRIQKKTDAEKLGAMRPSETYVGIAYSEGIWAYREDTVWDRGYLDLPEGQIRFRGTASNFGIALSQIQSIRLIQSRRFFAQSAPVVYVCWLDEHGVENYFSLETRDARSAEATMALRDLLVEAKQADGGLSKAKFSEMPFKSSSLEFSGQRIGESDIKNALGWAAFFLAVTLVVGGIVNWVWHTSFFFFTPAAIVSASIFRSVVYGRVVDRRKALTS